MLQEALQDFGLDQKEALCYLACLKRGTIQTTLISKETGLPRSTIHYVVNGLCEKGIMMREKRGDTFYFTAEEPEKLQLLLKREKNEITRRENILKKMMAELQEAKSKEIELPQVRYFTGIEGIQTMLTTLAKENKGKNLDSFAVGDYVAEQYPEWMQSYKKTLPESYKYIRTIRDPKYKKTTKRPGNEKRFYKNGNISPTVNIAITDDSIAFTSIDKRRPIAILIKNQDIANNLQMIFEEIWENATEK